MADQSRQLRWDGMETLPHNEPFRYSPEAGGAVAAAPDDVASLVRDTRREIGRLVREISQLARSGQSPELFWPAFLERVVRAMTADGALAWRIENGEVVAIGRAGQLDDRSLVGERRQIHDALVRDVSTAAAPVLVPPTPGATQGPANPTASIAALVPLETAGEPAMVLEIFLPEGGGPAAERGFLRFAAQMADLAGEYIRDAVLARLRRSNERWQRAAALSARWSTAGSVAFSAQEICEAFRDFTDCERASICLVHSNSLRLVATSGVVEPDRTSAEGRAIERCGRRALSGASVWETAERNAADEASAPTPDGDDVAEQATVSALQCTAAIPLCTPPPRALAELRPIAQLDEPPSPPPDQHDEECGEVVAVVVLEHDQPKTFDRHSQLQLRQIAGLAARDLRRMQMEEAFPLARTLLSAAAIWSGAVPRGLVVAGMAGILAVLLGLLPLPLKVVAPGTLRPANSESVYAASDGTVAEVFVHHGEYVEAGTALIRLVSPELDRAEEDLVGQKGVLREQLRQISRQSLEAGTSVAGERAKLENEQRVVEARMRSVDAQLASVRSEQDQLTIRCRQAGTIDAWEEEAIQIGRPIRRGELFLRVIDTSGPWEVIAEIPQDRLDHVDALLASHPSAETKIRLRAFPNRTLRGSLERLGPAAVAGSDGVPVAVARIRLDAEALPAVQPGSSATVALECGTRPAAYVVFQDLIRNGYGWMRLWLF